MPACLLAASFSWRRVSSGTWSSAETSECRWWTQRPHWAKAGKFCSEAGFDSLTDRQPTAAANAVKLDGSTLGNSEHLPIDLGRGIAIKKRPVDSAWLVGNNIPQQGHHAGLAGEVVEIQRAVETEYSSGVAGVGRLVELQVSGEDLALRLALRSVDAGRGPGRG